MLDPQVVDPLAEGTKGLRTVPPGFTRGLRLPGEEIEDDSLLVLDETSGTSDKQSDQTVMTQSYMRFTPYIHRQYSTA